MAPVVSGAGSPPRFDGQMAVTQECTTIFAVMKQSGQFETKLLRIEFDGFVEIIRRHTGMLQIGSEFRHCFRHKITS